MNKKALISLSGGMDSTTLLYWALNEGYDVSAISFDYGQNHKKEINFARKHCTELNISFEVVELDFLNKISNSSLTNGAENIPEGHYEEDNMKSTVIPFRNGLFLSILASYAEANEIQTILLGNHGGDHAIYPDTRGSFIDGMTKAIKEGTYQQVDIIAPFTDISKSDICRIGLKLNVPYKYTWSCYKGYDEPCGKCGTCIERTEAFLDNNTTDPSYSKNDWNQAVIEYNRIRVK